MTNHVLVICVCLVGLVLLAGCTGAEPAPRPLPPQEVRPVEDTLRGEGVPPLNRGQDTRDTDHVTESDDIAADVAKALNGAQEAAKPNTAEQSVDANEIGTSQPNEVVASPITQPPVEPNQPVQGEPDEGPAAIDATEPSEPMAEEAGEATVTAVEPNEPIAGETIVAEIEPQEPNEPAAVLGQATALPAFVEGYAQLLRDYVHEDGGIDFSGLYRRRLDVKQLLMRLAELDPNAYAAWPESEKLAFWINAYNLKMFEIITRNYPIESSWWLRLTWPPSDIRHIPGIWTDYKFLVMDEEFTLAEVERRFFHRTFNDPRAYLAVTYAGRSSPTLRRQPYFGADLDRQLDEQVKTFLTAGQGLRIDRREMVVYLSALFKPSWRGKEFLARFATDKKFKDRDPETRAVLSFLTGYLSREDAYFLETENYRIEYTNFDWRLNDASRSY